MTEDRHEITRVFREALRTEPKQKQEQVPKIKEHPKDRAVREWVARSEQENTTGHQVVGSLIGAGAEIVNYANPESENWKPRLSDKGSQRKMVYLNGNITGARYGAEALGAGIRFSVPVDESSSLGTEPLRLVPYLNFDPVGKLNKLLSRIFILRQSQVDTLKELLEK
ncbi:hypothetical protein ISS42_03350 [Candidatus Shapirobacteria bacterium]|nr:hypothetical protein [Candidatus Shapirobacteria bacterium]